MAGKTALVFPGMGPSSFSAVGKFMVLDPFARRRVAIADEALGYSLMDKFYESEDDYSEYMQVAFLINSLALADRAEAHLGLRPDFCVGPSFGQKAAAAYVESMEFADAVRFTAELARVEREFFESEHTDVVTHTFVRVPGERLDELMAELTDRGEWYEISGYLDDDFHMVSLREPLLEEFKQSIRNASGYSMYTMRPPVHARAFDGLRRKAEAEVFGSYEIKDPKLTLLADQDGSIVDSAAAMRTMLLDTFAYAINWPAVVRTLCGLGVDKLFITGPDNLFRRVDCTKRNFDVVTVDPKSALKAMLRPASR